MKNNGVYESDTIYDENVLEESFEGQSIKNDELNDVNEAITEAVNASDYEEVASTEETMFEEDLDAEDPFEGGETSAEENEAFENNSNEETLEQVSGYDYSIVDKEESFTETSAEENALSAYYASYDGADLETLMRTESGQRMMQEVVIGKDDRKKINATQKYPWRAICSLKIKAKDGTNWIGTGFLIGPRTVITAGHVVYMHKHGGWAKSIEVIPGRNGSSKPYGSCKTSHFHSVKGWTKKKKRINDYGAIILPKNCKLGNKVGYFGYAKYSFFKLLGLKVNLSGYPGDKPSGTQWWHCRKIKLVTARTLVYNIDTAGGQSGSPVWKYKNGKRYVVGIHTNGSKFGNSATRITSAVYKNLKNWKNKYK